jgi:colicin import membrane protein
MNDNSDLKYFLISLSLHLALFLVFAVKVVLFPGERPEHIRAVRVDFVALPDKDPQLGPPGEEKSEVSPQPKAEPVKKPESAKTSATEPDAKAVVKVDKNKTKEASPPKNDVKEQQNSALRRLEALARIKKKKSTTEQEGPEGVTVKGNRVSEGNSLTGVEKIEYNRYLADLDNHIKKNWHLPEWLAEKNLTSTILIKFDERGLLLTKKFLKNSGNPEFDKEAMQAVMSSTPFPPPPENLISYFKVQGIELRFPE